MVLNEICDLRVNRTPLQLKDLPVPTPKKKDILVKISACGVCHTELDEIEGRTPPSIFPMVLGHQVVGRIQEKGPHAGRYKTGDRVGLNFAYSGLGEVAVRMGEYTHASDLLEKGLSLSRLRGDKWMEATLLGSLGWVALRLGDFAAMRKSLGDSLSLRTEIGDQGGTAWCLEKLAEAVVLEGQYQNAVKIFASAASLRSPIDSVIDPVDQPEYERILSNLRSKLDPKTFAACWAEGASALRICAFTGSR